MTFKLFTSLALLTFLFLSIKQVAAETTPVDPNLCQALIKHPPSADVTYQPGVDVNGKPVAPADLPGQPQMELPAKLQIPLTVQLAKLLNLNPAQPPVDKLGAGTEVWLGTLTVEGDKVSYNGQPLTDAQQDNLAVLCLKQSGKP